MVAPFHPDRFVTAIEMAAGAGYTVLILDSLSHAWNGAGGTLELVEQYSKKYRGNSYAAWGDVTPIHTRLIEAIVAAPLHVIGTMRSKQDYILVEKNGKQAPQKVGMAPIQRDGFEYEFDVFLDMDIDNNAIVNKTRCPALVGGVYAKPGADVAAILIDWLSGEPEAVTSKPSNNGTPPEPTPEPAPAAIEIPDDVDTNDLLMGKVEQPEPEPRKVEAADLDSKIADARAWLLEKVRDDKVGLTVVAGALGMAGFTPDDAEGKGNKKHVENWLNGPECKDLRDSGLKVDFRANVSKKGAITIFDRATARKVATE